MESARRSRQNLSQRTRLGVSAIYVVALLMASWILGGALPPSMGSLTGLWFYVGSVTFLVAALVAEPYFTTPGQAVATGLALLLTAAGASASDAAIPASDVEVGRVVLMFVGAAISFSGLVAIVFRESARVSQNAKYATAWLAGQVGRPVFAFGCLYFAGVYAAFAGDGSKVFVALTLWVVIVAGAPIERVLGLARRIRTSDAEFQAIIETVIDPRTILIRRTGGSGLFVGNRVRVEAAGLVGEATVVDASEMLSSRLFRLCLDSALLVAPGQAVEVGVLPSSPSQGDVIGFAIPGTTNEELRARVHPTARHVRLEEGALVECAIGDQRVMYLVTESRLARDDMKDTELDHVELRGRKVGRWNTRTGKFEAVSWVPFPGAPVTMVEEPELAALNSEWVGLVPGTPYGVGLDVHELVTHNCAILGILGIGKTSLAWQLIQRMIVGEVKVVVLDITRRYGPYFDQVYPRAEDDAVSARVAEKLAARTPSNQIVRKLVETFASSDGRILVLNPAEFVGTGQTLADVTRLFAEELLAVARAASPAADPHQARFCLVLEEAHSLVPEWNSAVEKSEQYAVMATCRALLQGRKYGLGALVITQRTANVSKTLLNQCNSIAAMRVFDATGMEFLENYIGPRYTALLGALKRQQAILFGHAFKTTVPLVVDVYDSQAFRDAFWEPCVGTIPVTSVAPAAAVPLATPTPTP